ncbi:MAG: DNA polymerase III subunit delta [Oleibacter sp.]|nr:DNA polymerase III subunit delta [Thalassolituus sp.]
MKIRQDQLGGYLARGLAPIYLVSGDEPLLTMESCDLIRQAARQKGIEDRLVFHAEAGFDWNNVLEEASALSLFASQRILEIRIPNGKPTDKGAALKVIAERPPEDTIVLIICPRLDPKTQNTAWFKAIEKAGIFLPIWPIDKLQYSGWLARRLQMAGLQVKPAALAALAHQTEGNLLAAVQEIEKLRLSGVSEITEQVVNDVTGDSSRFTAFGLADACLLGQLSDAHRMLTHLRVEGNEPIMILGALIRTIRHLVALNNCTGQELSASFKRLNIWPKQQGPYKAALQRLTEKELHACMHKALEADLAGKGDGHSPWLHMAEIVGLMCRKI